MTTAQFLLKLAAALARDAAKAAIKLVTRREDPFELSQPLPHKASAHINGQIKAGARKFP